MLEVFDRIKTPKDFTVGATKYNAIKDGMYEEWLIDTGRASPENLDNKLPVQLGKFTEEFNKRWYTQQTGIKFADMSAFKFLTAEDLLGSLAASRAACLLPRCV